MARIRTIKPEYWTDGTMIRLPYEVRLFYIGLWNFACDRGHLVDDPFALKLKILPADPVDGDDLVDRLLESGRIERITLVDGRSFLSIPRFNDHQRVDTRWKSRCPVCAQADSEALAETHASLGETHGIETKPHVGGEGRGGERKGGEGEVDDSIDNPPPPRFCDSHPNGTERPCRPCMNRRRIREAWEDAEAAKPKPERPHVHRWLADGSCNTCPAWRHQVEGDAA